MERNNAWYLMSEPAEIIQTANELGEILGFNGREYVEFAPGSNYILTKENILKNPKELYQILSKYLEGKVYPAEAQIIERGLYYLFKL